MSKKQNSTKETKAPPLAARMLATLKDKIRIKLGLDNTRLLMIIDRWAMKRANGLRNHRMLSWKTNAATEFARQSFTFGLLIKFLEVIGAQNVKIDLTITLEDGEVIKVSEEKSLTQAKPLVIQTSLSKERNKEGNKNETDNK